MYKVSRMRINFCTTNTNSNIINIEPNLFTYPQVLVVFLSNFKTKVILYIRSPELSIVAVCVVPKFNPLPSKFT